MKLFSAHTRPAESSPAVERLLADTASRYVERMDARELRAELLAGGAFLLVAIPLALLTPGPRGPLGVGAALVLCYALASRVRFHVGTGYTDPSQLVFVSMLLLMSPGIAPLLVVGALILARLPEYLTRRSHHDRALLALGDSWYAVGPSLVLAIAQPGVPAVEHWPIYAAALLAQFAFDTGSFMVRNWLALGVPPRLTSQLMSWIQVVDVLLSPLGLVGAIATRSVPYAFLLAMPLLALLAVFARERRARIDHALELSRAYRGTALLLGEVVEADDAYTGEHSRGVVELALGVADALGLDDVKRRNVEFGALLHDIGKIAVPNEIINKPGPLDDDEWAVMKRHTIVGQELLERVGGALRDVALVVRCSHERFDGSGYPDGLAGEAIPIESRIVSCCDAYSAMTTDRSYRKAMSLADAVAELRRCAGTDFDPAVVAALLALVEHPDLTSGRPEPRPAPTLVGVA